MVRQQCRVGAGMVLGLLYLAVAGRADEAAAVKAIQKLGGTVTLDVKRPGKPVTDVDFGFTKVTDVGLKELKEFKSLRTLVLNSTQVTDAGLKDLKKLTSLELLELGDTKVMCSGPRKLDSRVNY